MVTAYAQDDKRWADKKIGHTDLTLGKVGSLICSLGMLLDKTPDKINDILTRNNCFNNVGELYCDQAAKALGLSYAWEKDAPGVAAIAETEHFRNQGVAQHFFLVSPEGTKILDPLDGQEKVPNPYKIVSYRVFRPKEGVAPI